MACIHKAMRGFFTSSGVPPMELMQTNPLMPKVDGNSHENIFHPIGMEVFGHEIPDRKSKGREVNTNISIAASRLGTKEAQASEKKTTANR